jgi:hypothetical protein
VGVGRLHACPRCQQPWAEAGVPVCTCKGVVAVLNGLSEHAHCPTVISRPPCPADRRVKQPQHPRGAGSAPHGEPPSLNPAPGPSRFRQSAHGWACALRVAALPKLSCPA